MARTIAIGIAIGFTALALLPLGMDKLSLTGRLWMLGNTIFLAGGYFAGKAFPIPEKRIVMSWIGAFVFTIVILMSYASRKLEDHLGVGTR